MSSPIVRPAAAGDIEDAYRWYEDQRSGLGDDFLVELRRTVDSILETPRLYPVMQRETRRALLHRFPYGVFYRVMDDRIVIVACMHGRRDPKIWRMRR